MPYKDLRPAVKDQQKQTNKTTKDNQFNKMDSKLRFALLCALMLTMHTVYCAPPNVIKFRAPNMFPHGFEWHKNKNVFLLGSLTTGQVYTVNDNAEVTQFTTDSRLNQRSAQGLELDYKRSELLIALGNSSAANLGEMEYAKNAFARADISTGEIKAFISLDEVRLESYKGTMLAGDMAVDPEGNVYVVETRGGFIWKIDTDNNATVYVSRPYWVPEAQFIPGIKGLVYSDNCDCLLVSKQGEGHLYKVTLGPNPNVTEVMFPTGMPDNFSGLTIRSNGNLIVVGRPPVNDVHPHIYEVVTSDSWETASIKYDVNATLTEPITAIERDSDVFVLHAYLNDYLTGRETFDITKAPAPISETYAEPSSSHELDESGASSVGVCLITMLVALVIQMCL